jgi:membrane protein implicated in regulation of membrane protease activity
MSIFNITLDTIWKVYYYIALSATILFTIKLFLFVLFGGGSEVITDFNMEIDTDCSFNFLSVQSVLAFFMGFGWMGYAAILQFGFSQLATLISSIIVGLVFLFVSAGLMFAVKHLEKKVVKDKNTALNKIGQAYINFAPKSKGQVEIEINGQLSVVDAMNNSDEEIKAFEEVEVVKIENDMLYVEKVQVIPTRSQS